MAITWIGGIGVGFVWGWLIVQFGNGIYFPSSKNQSIWLGSILMSVFTYFLAGWLAAVFFLAATVTAVFIHAMWLYNLRSRFGISDLEEEIV